MPCAAVTAAAVVGDIDVPPSAGIGGGLTQRPTPGKTATALEIVSDPMGVDFKPYLIRILATVKRNWLAVTPESARLGPHRARPDTVRDRPRRFRAQTGHRLPVRNRSPRPRGGGRDQRFHTF